MPRIPMQGTLKTASERPTVQSHIYNLEKYVPGNKTRRQRVYLISPQNRKMMREIWNMSMSDEALILLQGATALTVDTASWQ